MVQEIISWLCCRYVLCCWLNCSICALKLNENDVSFSLFCIYSDAKFFKPRLLGFIRAGQSLEQLIFYIWAGEYYPTAIRGDRERICSQVVWTGIVWESISRGTIINPLCVLMQQNHSLAWDFSAILFNMGIFRKALMFMKNKVSHNIN